MQISPYRIYGFVLCLGLGIGISPAYADSCKVAKIYKVSGIDTVLILRAQGKEPEPASQQKQDRMLCVGDIVIVPKSIPSLKLRYYKPPHRIMLKGGEQHLVCENNTWGLKCFLTSTSVMGRIFRKPEINPKNPIPLFMPLAAGEKADAPFYLFSSPGDIPLVWYGGQSPYQLEVKEAAAQVIVQPQVEVPENTFSLTVPHTEPGSEYTVTIQSAESESKPLRKTLKFIEPPQFTSEDPWLNLASLLADCDKTGQNWKLEIWRQLSAMQDSEQKKNFMDHLEADDLDIDNFELCQ